MDATLSWTILRLVARLRAKSMIDTIALASVPLAAILIGATVALG